MAKGKLHGKTIIVTGASAGIGRHMVRECAKQGASTLIIIARSEDKLERLKAELGMQYDEVTVDVYPLDIGNLEALQNTFEAIKWQYSTIDVLINNAGFGIFSLFEEASFLDMKTMLDVNVLGMMAATRMLLPKMRQQGEGHIINVASIAGKMATPKSSVYSATKAAVLGFTNGLRSEVRRQGIKVTAVNPGPIKTNFFKIADPEGNYVKNVERWMVSPESVAEKVVAAIGTNKREINLPFAMHAGAKLYQMFPRTVEKIAGGLLNKK
ncbi:short-subunit dehydrogenase [Pullulanibacillus pueri]|uniref:Putative oxidoreductase YqjQ n=1 Tax=Pullulanibacillus pueri TaxID=1437324 RepID=A0A8J2ZUI4_9BACL|nr:SDR family oxidoreductase [Pullulanibacillus pueri]MBM7681630.1 short-subunit dehydrogenase [Pullulanibacillus pueri]GGH79386.1 putative oxidoreductase YqjQ [Pullulanibacillus pueri]